MFDKEFDTQFSDMQKQVKKIQGAAIAVIAVSTCVGIGVLIFLGWILIKVLQNFEVLT